MIKHDLAYQKKKGSSALLLGAAFALGVTLVVILFWLATQNSSGLLDGQETFIALLFVLGCILWAPSLYLALKRDFDPFHPLIFPVWTYLFPSFVLGGLMFSNPDFFLFGIIGLIPNPEFYLPLSVVYIILGFIGLVAGFALPLGRRIGQALSPHVPSWRWDAENLLHPAILMISFGAAAYVLAYKTGVVGYQVTETPSLFGGLAYFVSTVGDLGAFLLWWAYWGRREEPRRRSGGFDLLWWSMAFLLWAGRIALFVLLSGSRASLLAAMLQVMAAYCLVRRTFSKWAMTGFALVIAGALVIGFVWGTTYREIKESESQVSLGEGLQIASDAFAEVANRGFAENAAYAFLALIGRVETLSNFAVIVSNYQRLYPVEKEYGMANNIFMYTWTAFIPRFLWPEKPLVSDARSIGEIYFGFPDNSFAMTFFGDLLRNFGPLGIPAGMALLGLLLRLLYTVGVKEGNKSAWRSACYFMLLTAVNYESFFGTILPNWIRLAFVLLLGGVMVNAIVRLERGRKALEPGPSETAVAHRRPNQP